MVGGWDLGLQMGWGTNKAFGPSDGFSRWGIQMRFGPSDGAFRWGLRLEWLVGVRMGPSDERFGP